MTQPQVNYSELADAARAAAAEQVLDNVRQKHLIAAATWDALALGKRKMDALRLRRILERERPGIVEGEGNGG